jgi:hypothetical protein
MLMALAVIAAAAGVVIAGALVASDSSRGSSSDRWLISGPHSSH